MNREMHLGDLNHVFFKKGAKEKRQFEPGKAYAVYLGDNDDGTLVYARSKNEQERDAPAQKENCAKCGLRVQGARYCNKVDCADVAFDAIELSEVDDTTLVFKDSGKPVMLTDEPVKKLSVFESDLIGGCELHIYEKYLMQLEDLVHALEACATEDEVDQAARKWSAALGPAEDDDERKQLLQASEYSVMKMKEIVREKNGKQEPEDEPSPMMPEQRAYKRAKWESDLLELDKRAREEERKECAAKLQAKEAGARAKKLRKKMQDILSMGSENYVGETPLFDGLEDEPADGGEKLDADVVEWVLSAKEQFEETVNA